MANLKKGGGWWPSKIGISQSGLAWWRATENRLSSVWLRTGRKAEASLFVLEDGRKFKSASSAASAVMGGKAVNGWRFWSVQGAEPRQRKEARSLKRRPQSQRGWSTASRTRRG